MAPPPKAVTMPNMYTPNKSYSSSIATIAPEIAKAIVSSKNLTLGGMCPHFAVADSLKPEDIKYTEDQYNDFMKAVKNSPSHVRPLHRIH